MQTKDYGADIASKIAIIDELRRGMNEARDEHARVMSDLEQQVIDKQADVAIKLAELEKKLDTPEVSISDLRAELNSKVEDIEERTKLLADIEFSIGETQAVLDNKESALNATDHELTVLANNYIISINKLTQLEFARLKSWESILDTKKQAYAQRERLLSDRLRTLKATEQEMQAKWHKLKET